jgi:riboflavin kinase/FMN adenylyltransferase
MANKLLGHEYGFEGIVMAGDNRGRTLGYPTVNIEAVSANKLIPADGVYCVKVEFEKEKFYGMMNIGFSPTLTEGIKRVMEVNIFEFDRDIYGGKIYINFLTRLRSEIKYKSKDELVNQLHQDKKQSLNYLKSKK